MDLRGILHRPGERNRAIWIDDARLAGAEAAGVNDVPHLWRGGVVPLGGGNLIREAGIELASELLRCLGSGSAKLVVERTLSHCSDLRLHEMCLEWIAECPDKQRYPY